MIDEFDSSVLGQIREKLLPEFSALLCGPISHACGIEDANWSRHVRNDSVGRNHLLGCLVVKRKALG